MNRVKEIKKEKWKLASLSWQHYNFQGLVASYLWLTSSAAFFPFYSCWKSRGALTRVERIERIMGKWSKKGEAHRRGCERGCKRKSEANAHGWQKSIWKTTERFWGSSEWKWLAVSCQRGIDVIFFPVENAVLITVYQIVILWEFSILPDSYFKFVLERNCHAAGNWHFCQALIIHVFYLEAKSVRSFQSGSYSWADGERWAWCLLPAICLEASHHGNSLPPRQKSDWQEPFKTVTSKSNKAFVLSDWNVSLFRSNETWMYKQFCEKSLTLQMTLESTKVLWYLLASASTS